MAAAVLIPWRGGCPHRQAALDWLRNHLDLPVVIGTHDDGPWVKALAVADALHRTDADVLVIHDADVWVPNLPDAIERCAPGRWVIPHGLVYRLDEPSTAAVLNGGPMGGSLTQRAYRGHPGGGVVIVHRADYQQAPLDPRFQGWGQEDDAWALALTRIVGKPLRLNADLWHLWHPPQDRQSRVVGSTQGAELFARYRNARTREAMTALLEEVTWATSAST